MCTDIISSLQHSRVSIGNAALNLSKIIISVLALNFSPDSYIEILEECHQIDSYLKKILLSMLVGTCDLIFALELLKQYDIAISNDRTILNETDKSDSTPIEKLFITACDVTDRFIISNYFFIQMTLPINSKNYKSL